MVSARALALALLTVGASALACEAVVDTDVEYQGGSAGREDGDDPDGDATADAEADADDAGAEADAVDPGTCACGERACCIGAAGAASCVDADGSTCLADDGLLLRCTQGDENGRVCCFSSDMRTSRLGASCDGGLQACRDAVECGGAPCSPFTCRGVTLSACGADAAPACP